MINGSYLLGGLDLSNVWQEMKIESSQSTNVQVLQTIY